MATKQVNIDIIAKDKTRQAMQSATKGVDRLKNSFFNLRNAMIGIGVGAGIKSLIDVGNQVESLQIRFETLFGSAEEGAKAFDTMAKFAGKVPFSLREIQAGSGSLLAVADDADDLGKLLEMTGVIAGATGLDFQTASEQIQRSLSAGIASAELFRERGVTALLGFEAGVSVSAEDSRKALEKFAKDNEGITDRLAGTFQGTLSMIGDAIFTFQRTINDAGFFSSITAHFKQLKDSIDSNQAEIQEFARNLSDVLVKAMSGFVEAVKFVARNFDSLIVAVKAFIALKVGIFVGTVVQSFVGLKKALQGATVAQGAFNVVALANPYVAGATVIAGGIMFVVSTYDKLIETIKRSEGKLKELRKEGVAVIDFENQLMKQIKKRQIEDLKNLETKTKQIKVSKELKDALADQRFEVKLLEATIRGATEADLEILKVRREFKGENKEVLAQLISEIKLRQAHEATIKKEKDALEAIANNKSNINSIKESLMTELELIEDKNKKELELIAQQKELIQEQIDSKLLKGMETNSKELEMAREHLEELTALEMEVRKRGNEEKIELARQTAEEEKKIRDELFADNLRAIKEGNFHELQLEKLSMAQQKDLTIKTGRELVSQLAQSNKTMFKVDKALKIAQAIMNTSTGVTKALSVGNIPLAVLIGGLGAVEVATISAQKYQGFAKGGRPPVGRASIVGEEGAELFVPDQAGTIVPNDKLGMGKPVTVNFNINTVDATGFEELLVNSRGVLINLINSAVNEKGQRAII